MNDAAPGRPSVVGVVGSPRRGGNTEILVEEVLSAARDAGAGTETIFLADLVIGPCRGCNACAKKGRCVQDDDMHAVVETLASARCWVLGTPVYWWGPTAWFKAFLDRWYGEVRRLRFKEKKAVLAIPLGDTDVSSGDHTRGMLETALQHVGAEILAVLMAPGAGERGDVRANEAVLEAARDAGRRAAGA